LAVTYGGFNFVSIGHVNFLETILKEWSQVFVLILPNNNICNPIVYPDKDTNDFLSICNDSIQKKKLLPIVD
jgi:nicotinic acid mononucleotide adenylyltransferase